MSFEVDMSHLFKEGNTLAVGEGRPRKYTDEFIENEMKEFYKWMDLEDSIWFENFAIKRKYNPNRLNEMAKEHEGFSVAYKIAKKWQQGRLIQYGLFGKTKEGLTKFILSAVHNMKEAPPEQPAQHRVILDIVHQDTDESEAAPECEGVQQED